jgi:hypothetical protein
MLGDYDQMEKGPRFIWYNWTQCESATLRETGTEYIWEGVISAFRHVARGIRHFRRVRKMKDRPVWIVEDHIHNKPPGLPMFQLWHTPVPERLKWSAYDRGGKLLQPQRRTGKHAALYGVIEANTEISVI